MLPSADSEVFKHWIFYLIQFLGKQIIADTFIINGWSFPQFLGFAFPFIVHLSWARQDASSDNRDRL